MGVQRMTLYFGPAPKPRRRLGDRCRDRDGKIWKASAKTTKHRDGTVSYVSNGRGNFVLEWVCEDGRRRDRRPPGAKDV